MLPGEVVPIGEGIDDAVAINSSVGAVPILSLRRANVVYGTGVKTIANDKGAEARHKLRARDSQLRVAGQTPFPRDVGRRLDIASAADSCARIIDEAIGKGMRPVDDEPSIRVVIICRNISRQSDLCVTAMLPSNGEASRDRVSIRRPPVDLHVALIVLRGLSGRPDIVYGGVGDGVG